MIMKFIGLLILSAFWLGFIFLDSGSSIALEEISQSFLSPVFVTSGVLPVLIGWSVFLMLTAFIEMRAQKI